MSDRDRIFKLLETADNFVKYAPPGRLDKAALRARRRYEKAGKLAEAVGDGDMLEQVRLRLGDLERRAALPPEEVDATTDNIGGSIATSDLPVHAQSRVPPGQRVTRGWPVLHEGPIPRFDPATWSFEIRGETAREVSLSYEELRARPHVEMRSDFHCVTGWSKLDNVWTGVRTKDLLADAGPTESAAHVVVHAEHGYTANLPLAVLLEDDALVAWSHNGDDLAPKHGWPLRLVVPKLYAWKSVKWVRGFEVTADDRRGFWEIRGYHNRADPWLEERYSFQEERA